MPRKSCGTLLAESGVHPRVALEIMRHSDIRLTMETYTEFGEDGARRHTMAQHVATHGRRREAGIVDDAAG